jgi:hypothetical protein
MSVSYQALLGETSIDASYVNVDTLNANEIDTKDLKVTGTTILNDLIFPNGAQDGYRLTSDIVGNASWQPPTTVVPLNGDVIGQSDNNLIEHIYGHNVNEIVFLDEPQTLTNKTITGTTNSVDANTLRSGSAYAIALGGSAPTTNQVLSYNGMNAVWTSRRMYDLCG